MTPPALGTFGSMGRNIFRGTGLRAWDLSLVKDWKFAERVKLQFRGEFFNVLNHPNFANPYGVNLNYAESILRIRSSLAAPAPRLMSVMRTR